MRGHHLGAWSLMLGLLYAAVPVPSSGQPSTPPPPAVIETRGAPSLGPDNAPVTIVEFGDFQCPFCAQGAQALRRLVRVYPDRVRWVFKHFPLRSLHPGAALAHEAAIVAQEQGKFWEMHELIFQNQTRVKYSDLVGYAQEIGLDMVAFKDALETRRLRHRVIRDMEEARVLGVFATPTYYVNGTRYMGARTTSELRILVDSIARRPVITQPGATDAPSESSATR
jgi:protein-disulfide isomerase